MKPTRYEIRRKEFDFGAAPDLTGHPDAAYVPMLVKHMATSDPTFPATFRDDALRLGLEGPRFGRALDAAVEAARMCDDALRLGLIDERCAFVKCEHTGPRPPGAMKGYAYVSYRVRD